MQEQPSWAISPEAAGNSEIATLNSKILALEMRLLSLEGRIPNSNIISQMFWSRALAVFGHYTSIVLVFYAIIFAIFIAFWILGAIIGK
jgi:hypothetical protein